MMNQAEEEALISTPSFDSSQVTPGILHIGTGKFSLAFLGPFVQDILRTDPSWGIVASSIRSCEVVEHLKARDGMYLLQEKDQRCKRLSLLAPIVETVAASRDPDRLVQWLADPRIRVVTLTVTSEGYFLQDGALNLGDWNVQFDLNWLEGEHHKGGAAPRTIYGYLVNGLTLRRQRSKRPLTIMSLDNCENNGTRLQTALLTILRHTEPETAEWVEENVQFLTTMVDRIASDMKVSSLDTAARSANKHRAEKKKTNSNSFSSPSPDPCLGHVQVHTETFKSFVIAPNNLKYENPDWTQAGAEVVQDCGYYWKRKAFLVNGGHHVIAVCGQRLGYTWVHDALKDPRVYRLLSQLHRDFCEVLLSIPGCPDTRETLAKYASSIRERFRNEQIADSISRISRCSTRKVAQRFFEPILQAYEASQDVLLGPAFAAAIWMVNFSSSSETGSHIEQDDPLADNLLILSDKIELCATGKASPAEVQVLLRQVGEVLDDSRFLRVAEIKEFIQLFTFSLQLISALGLQRAIEHFLDTEHQTPSSPTKVSSPSGTLSPKALACAPSWQFLLLDCDGTLVNSETYAFEACTGVLNELLQRKGVSDRYLPHELESAYVGMAFRGIVLELAKKHNFAVGPQELDELALQEDARVTGYLQERVETCSGVSAMLEFLEGTGTNFAVVSSSSLPRVRACLEKTRLDLRIPKDHVYSAVSSLPVPKSKPDKAVYCHALQDLRAGPDQCVAIEDSVNGTLSAVGAGIPVIGYVGSLPPHKRELASKKLEVAGARAIMHHWEELSRLLQSRF